MDAFSEKLKIDLPKKPPRIKWVQEKLLEWEEVTRVNPISTTQEGDETVVEYMIVNTTEHRGWRVIWQDSKWLIQERSSTY